MKIIIYFNRLSVICRFLCRNQERNEVLIYVNVALGHVYLVYDWLTWQKIAQKLPHCVIVVINV